MPTYVTLRSVPRTRSASVRVPTVITLAAPAGPAAVKSGSAGAWTGASATYFYKITALGDSGETTGSTQVSAVIDTAVDDIVTLSWTAVTGAASYRVYRGVATNTQTMYFAATTNSYVDTGGAGTAGTVPTSNTASTRGNQQVLRSDVDTLVNIDSVRTRKALNAHRAIGQWVVTSVNNKLADGTTLPSNS